MKFNIVTYDPTAENINDSKHTYHFLRNLNTEKMFRDELGAELQAQLSTLFQIMSAVDSAPQDMKAIERRLSLEFSETRHECLKFMYAELTDAGTLKQGESTRQAFELLDDLDEQRALETFFRNV